MNAPLWIGVAAFGVAATLRFLVDGAVSRRIDGGFPWGTLAVNLSGAFVLGILTGLALSDPAALVAGTAVVGSYTTFSTWMLETQRLAEEGEVAPPAANLLISPALGMALAAAGWALGSVLA